MTTYHTSTATTASTSISTTSYVSIPLYLREYKDRERKLTKSEEAVAHILIGYHAEITSIIPQVDRRFHIFYTMYGMEYDIYYDPFKQHCDRLGSAPRSHTRPSDELPNDHVLTHLPPPATSYSYLSLPFYFQRPNDRLNQNRQLNITRRYR